MLVKSQRLSELKVDVCSHNVVVGVLREQERALQAEKEGLERQLAAVTEEADRERFRVTVIVHHMNLVTPTDLHF